MKLRKYCFLKKEPYGTNNALKYFIGYNDSDVIRPLCLRLPQMAGYAKTIGLIISLSLYPVKYLSAFFVPYGCFLETNILLISKSTNWNAFLFL